MSKKSKLLTLTLLTGFLIVLYLSLGLTPTIWRYALKLRLRKLAGILIVAAAIGSAATIFQTITNNRILTPSVLGLNSLYLFLQSFLVFFLGSANLIKLGVQFNFILSVLLMVGAAFILFQFLFKKEEHNIFLLLLLGLVMGTFFRSLATFIQVLIDPNEFMLIQDRSFASFNNLNLELLYLAVPGLLIVLFILYKNLNILDVLSLGRENAINLGVDYEKSVKLVLILTSILISISTALVGPITFLGILVVNLARELMQTYKHKFLLAASILSSIIALVGGQLLTEKIFNFATPISVLINFIGGFYLIIILTKETKL
ncbi:iron chelate uptake ABC transporter family permease subunit [Halanaerobium praevalens]|uniref:Transport system permease protein n=1 Tax=Halanaerobium praevalens (strain ATCC 33744 / DSM 2228 / GSL) TaxID=572479 RepID=E3DME3_HALPG|nr:iron chelate uptake ABC transporter family permease subunit [Halanaerobium praevalens]ADO76336.1 transport system permease protein [Halanaerobium praevalens DSM 2228]